MRLMPSEEAETVSMAAAMKRESRHLTSCFLRWMVLIPPRVYLYLVQQTDLKFLIKRSLDPEDLTDVLSLISLISRDERKYSEFIPRMLRWMRPLILRE